MTHVLVIDDESTIRWSIEQTLRAAGYTVALAENGTEGMRLFRELDPAVVLLDVRLPDEDGFTLPDMRAMAGPSGSFAISVEKSADLQTWSPVLLQTSSDPAKAFYRLRLQR